jgi:crotonobetainyl-CoA:carnitine CoA-transferase CaiB-like acyl-CoA transferase
LNIFDGLKVLDVASFIAAPMAATILSDFGARVIKVEQPQEGDAYRKVFRLPNLPVCEHNYAWALAGRNKQGLALDLKLADGQAVLHRLAAEADVLITNFPPGVRARLGLDYEQLAQRNPRLIYASMTGHGETGPEASKPGFDATTFWARSGLADLVRPDPSGPPASVANGMGDHQAALALYGAIVTALYRRERTGCGGKVSTSLLANGAWANSVQIQAVLSGGEVPYRQPRAKPRNALTNYYKCQDGRWLILSLLTEEKQWPVLVRLLERPELLSDARFATLAARRENASVLVAELDDTFARHPSSEWARRLESAGLTASAVARASDVPLDPQMRECGALVVSDSVAGGWTIDSPIQIDGAQKVRPGHAPEVGQHSEQVLKDWGYAAGEIADLRERGVIA